jgi:DNA-binding MarR family transcriptional regulator
LDILNFIQRKVIFLPRTRKPSFQEILVLLEFLYSKDGLYGYELNNKTDIPFGTLYVILRRLEDNSYIEGEWVKEKRHRRIYRLTTIGYEYALRSTGDELKRIAAKRGDLPVKPNSGSRVAVLVHA